MHWLQELFNDILTPYPDSSSTRQQIVYKIRPSVCGLQAELFAEQRVHNHCAMNQDRPNT